MPVCGSLAYKKFTLLFENTFFASICVCLKVLKFTFRRIRLNGKHNFGQKNILDYHNETEQQQTCDSTEQQKAWT